MFEIIKTYIVDDALFYSVLLVLVGVVSFGLGKLSVQEQMIRYEPAPATVLTASSTFSSAVGTSTGEPELVGSINGDKYHYLWCPSADRITEANRIYFSTTAEARAKGYMPAANCAGLD